jgi:3-oxoacyl-[acyl-carrier protein] reductase
MEDALIGMATEAIIQKTFSVNVFAPINMIQYATKIMKKLGRGSIVNISSIVGTNGNAGQIVYSASKGAVISLTKTAAKELAPNNIRVNAIAPGMIDTAMFRSIGEPRISERISKIGMGRLGTAEEVADAALFLASDLSVYITGQIIGVDGAAII